MYDPAVTHCNVEDIRCQCEFAYCPFSCRALPFQPAPIHAAEVPLLVRNHTGVNQVDAPVRGGVPFPLGALKTCDQARLMNAAGTEIPCQIKPIAHWYDGSIKWLLVDTRMTLPASGDVGRAPAA